MPSLSRGRCTLLFSAAITQSHCCAISWKGADPGFSLTLVRTSVSEYPGSAPFHEIAQQCDWVIAAENSNVHLPLLKLGIPTVAVTGLGLYPRSRSDLYGL